MHPPCDLSENARVCEMTVKRTRLCYWIARLAKPGVQSSNTSWVYSTVISHTPVLSGSYHIYIVYKRNWVTRSCMFFQIRNWFHCVAESWWNMPFKGTWHGTGVADGAVAKLPRLWQHASALWRHAFEYVLWRRTMHEWVMNIHYQAWIAQGRFINIIRTPS